MNNLLSYTQTNPENIIPISTPNKNKIEDLMDLLINTNSNSSETHNTTKTTNLVNLDFNNNNLLNFNSNFSNNNNDFVLNTDKFYEFFRNDEISFSFTLNRSFDGSINSVFYMSNLKTNKLNNVKINFSVQKFVTLKVLNTSGNVLNPMEIRGIKKVRLNL